MTTRLRNGLGASLLALLVASAPLPAQECRIVSVSGGCGASLGQVGPALAGLLDNVEAPSSGAVAQLVARQLDTVRVGDLSLRFRTFQAGDAGLSALGLSYAWEKTLAESDIPSTGTSFSTLELDASARGNVAFGDAVNPRDFLESAVRFQWFKSWGGTRGGPAPVEVSQELIRIASALSEVDTEAISTHPLHLRALELVQDQLSTQVALGLSADGRLESDQAFDHRQLVYGGTVGLDVRAWSRASDLARLNVLDWPFAALRYMTGLDASLSPRGSALPSVRVSLHQVDPQEDSIRTGLGETGSFTRFSMEAGYRTLAGRVGSDFLYFEANVRYFQELSPSAAVETAGIDDSFYFVTALTTTAGPYVSYSTGELPFDRRSDHVYELGFRYKL